MIGLVRRYPNQGFREMTIFFAQNLLNFCANIFLPTFSHEAQKVLRVFAHFFAEFTQNQKYCYSAQLVTFSYKSSNYLLYLLRKIAQNRIRQKRKSAILREIKFANDCTKSYFSAQKCNAPKAKICAFFRKITQKFCEWKP